MKKILLFLLLTALSLSLLSGCGGGGAAPANVPTGESPGTPAVVQLNPVNYVAQTGATIYLKAKVLDSNGIAVPNIPVTFSNLSSTGSLSPASVSATSLSSKSATVAANTDSSGIATVRLDSGITGFVTIQSEIGGGISIIRDKRTVYFSSYSLTYPAAPYIVLDVDGNNNGIYNETDDLTLFQNAGDNQVVIRATVFASSGTPVSGATVTFGADRPYKAGSGACSGGAASCDVVFPSGNTPQTDSMGRAYVLVQVNPTTLTSLPTVLNITASASNGAASMVSLTLNPVTISSISMTAKPTIIQVDGTSSIIAALKTSLGTPAPDGTTVSFNANCGIMSPVGQINPPFAQTTSGSATSTLNAPSSPGSCEVFGTSGGLTASVFVSVIPVPTTPTPTTPAALTIVPGSVTVVSSASAQTVSFTISGGTAPYTTTSTDPSKAFNDNGAGGGTASDGIRNGSESGVWTGSPITVTIPASVAADTVTLNVYDSTSATVTATLTILGGGGGGGSTLAVSPSIITLTGTSDTTDNVTFTITGGSGTYAGVFSDNTAVIPNPTIAVNKFTINPNPVATSTTVTLTVMDSLGATKTVTVTVTPASAPLAINPSAISMTNGSTTTFYIIGGVGPFNVVSSNAAKVTVNGSATTSVTAAVRSFTVGAVAAGSATITVVDTGNGNSTTSAVTVN